MIEEIGLEAPTSNAAEAFVKAVSELQRKADVVPLAPRDLKQILRFGRELGETGACACVRARVCVCVCTRKT